MERVFSDWLAVGGAAAGYCCRPIIIIMYYMFAYVPFSYTHICWLFSNLKHNIGFA